jgi:hypothetical protein
MQVWVPVGVLPSGSQGLCAQWEHDKYLVSVHVSLSQGLGLSLFTCVLFSDTGPQDLSLSLFCFFFPEPLN